MFEQPHTCASRCFGKTKGVVKRVKVSSTFIEQSAMHALYRYSVAGICCGEHARMRIVHDACKRIGLCVHSGEVACLGCKRQVATGAKTACNGAPLNRLQRQRSRLH